MYMYLEISLVLSETFVFELFFIGLKCYCECLCVYDGQKRHLPHCMCP